jgi:hypothetical protein
MDINQTKEIYAIVLSYDENHIFVDNLLFKMQKLWPNSGMIYRIPYNSERPTYLVMKYKGLELELIKTPSTIKETVLSLIADLHDNDWIYWCIDDKFPFDINKRKAQQTLNWVRQEKDEIICGVSFAKVRVLEKLKKTSSLARNSILHIEGNIKLIRRESFASVFWMPQFFRKKIIRKVFNSFPDNDFEAKRMDDYLKEVKMDPSFMFYVTEKNYVVLGESASRGIGTQSLKRSMKECGISNYSNKTFSNKHMIIGHMYTFRYYKTKTWSIMSSFKKLYRNALQKVKK